MFIFDCGLMITLSLNKLWIISVEVIISSNFCLEKWFPSSMFTGVAWNISIYYEVSSFGRLSLPVYSNCYDCQGGHIRRHTWKCLHKPARGQKCAKYCHQIGAQQSIKLSDCCLILTPLKETNLVFILILKFSPDLYILV